MLHLDLKAARRQHPQAARRRVSKPTPTVITLLLTRPHLLIVRLSEQSLFKLPHSVTRLELIGQL